MKNLFTLLLICIFAFSGRLSAQISGIQNVPGAFPDLAAAFAALNAQGVGAGGATINITAPQTSPVDGFQLGSAVLNASLTGTNTLIINGNGNIITGYTGTRAGSLTSGVNDAIFVLNGVDYTTIQNLVFNDPASNNTPTLAMEHAIGMYNRTSTPGSADGCRYITVTGCTFNMGSFSSSGAAVAATQYVWNVAAAVAWDAASQIDIHRSITIHNNQFSSIYNGIHFRGATSRNGRALVVTNNTFTDIGGGTTTSYGTYMLYLDSIVYNNNISIGSLSQTSISYHAYAFTNCGGEQEAINNTITMRSGTTTSTINGITLTSIGTTRKINNNTIIFGTFPAITSGPINGLVATYSGGNNNFTSEMNGNIINNQVLPPTTGTIVLISNSLTSGTNRITQTNNNTITNITKSNSGILTIINIGTTNEAYCTNNTINNITITNNSASAAVTLRPIYGFGVPPFQSISNNTISNILVSGTSTSTASQIRCIESNTTSTGNGDVFNNTIFNISIGTGVNTGTVTGIYLAANSNNAYRNKIYNLSASQAGLVRGIEVASGPVVNIYNNAISGLSAPNANSNIAVSGIHMTGGVNANVSYNTIYPSSAGPLTSTGAIFGATGILFSATATNIAVLKNNIVNITGTAAGDAYISAVKRAGIGTNGTKPANLSGSNNIYNAPYIFGEGPVLSTATNVYYVVGGTTGTPDPTFNTSCGLYKLFMGEAGTFTENNLTSVSAGLFAPSGVSFAESSATSTTVPVITDDINLVNRGTFPDMGSLQFAGAGLDATGPVITYTPLPNTICTNNVTVTAVISDFSGINVAAGTRPRLWYKRSTHNNVLPLNNTNATNGWKFVEANNTTSPFTFTMDFSLIFGGVILPGQTVDYFIVAQDLAATPNVSTNMATYPTGFCPTSVSLPAAAFPVSGYNTFNILASPVNITTVASRTEICISGDITLSLGGDPSTGAQYQWQSSPAGVNLWTNISGANNATLSVVGLNASTDYRCVISCGGSPIAASPSATVTINVTNPQILSTTPAITCTPGPVSLSLGATASPGATINWYANATGGLPIGTGSPFNTPPITNTTTYYAAASIGGSSFFTGLPAALPTATSGAGTTNFGIVFNALVPFVLESVVVYPIASTANTPGTVTIDVIDANNNILNTTTVNVIGNPTGQATAQTVLLNFSIAPGTNLKLRPGSRSTSITGLLFEPSASAPGGNYGYPYNIPGVLNILHSTLTAAPTNTARLDLYYYFYNWKVVTGCESSRVPVTAAIVTSAPLCPADTTVCLASAPFNLNGGNPAGGVYSGTGVSNGMFSPSVAGPGTHVITYTLCGFTCTFNITVQNPAATIMITESSGPVNNDGFICNGASATLTASGGVSYVWSNMATTAAITVASAGTYTVTVTTAVGCTASTSATITIIPAPTTSTTVTQPSTCLSTDGAIDLTVTPAGSYSYLWSNGATTQDIGGLNVATYNVTITDNTSTCTSTVSVTLVGPGGCDVCPAIPTVTVSPSPACAGQNITFTAANLTDMGVTYGVAFKSFAASTSDPYTGGTVVATVTNGMLTSNKTIATANANIPTAGNYVIYAVLSPTPADPGCRPSAVTNILINPLPVASISVSETSGLVNNDGIICQGATAMLTASGGGTYAWSTGATSASITVSTGATFTVTVTSSNGCTAVASRIITVSPVPVPVITFTETSGNTINDGIICQGASVTLTCVTAGTYVWSTGASTASISTTMAGTYTVTVTNAGGCSGTASANVIVNPIPVPGINVVENSGVPNDGTIIEGASAMLTATGGGTYRWNTLATTATITVSPVVTTTYTVTVTSAAGCTATSMVTITVVPPPCDLVCVGNQIIALAPGECEHFIYNVVDFVGQCDIYTIVQTNGPAVGTKVGRGVYPMSFELRRKNNGLVVQSCSFTITVQGFAIPTGTLTCNDHVNISVDQNCRVTLNADMFLEGTNYACYWDYQINVWPYNNQANIIRNIPQGVPVSLPYGNHTYEIVGSDGNRCWGTFTVEDKLPPVVSCNCMDITTITPVTSFSGVLNNNSDRMWRVTTLTTTTCTLGTAGTMDNVRYEDHPFTVTANGNYTFTRTYTPAAGSTLVSMYLYEGSFDPASPCTNLLVVSTATTLTRALTAGVNYILVVANINNEPDNGTYNVNVTTTTGGIVQIATNPSWLPECQFRCVDIEIVKRETIGMLYNIPGQNANRSKLTTPPTASDCGAITRSFEDVITPSDCGQTKLVRNWTFTDPNGNRSFCSQTYSFNPLRIRDLTPPTEEVYLTCGLDGLPNTIVGYTDIDSRSGSASAANIGNYADDYSATPTVVELNEGFINGYFTYEQTGFDGLKHRQKVDLSTCNIYTTYTDDMFPACGNGCGGNMKIIRTWKIFDWCTKQTSEYVQIIKAVDDKAPSFDVEDITISVNPWECVADWRVEVPEDLNDNCAKPSEIKWGVKVNPGIELVGIQPNYRIFGLTKGEHQVIYYAEDCCGNYFEKSITITVIDASGPVPVAKQNIVVSLTGSGSAADGAAKLYGWQIDNGSYDQCSDVRFEVRRLSGGSCGNTGTNGTHNNNSTYNDNNGYTSEIPGQIWFHPNDNREDTDEGEFVKFCCEDIPAGAEFGLHDVELRVWDDGNMNGIYGDNFIINGMKDNYNTTWVTVRVENKLPPVLICPPNVTVTCDMDINLSLDTDTNVKDVNLTMTGIPRAYDLCSEIEVNYRDAWIGNSNPVCKTGTIRRTFTARKGSVVVTCPQIITIGGITVPFTVNFPQNNQTTVWNACEFTLDDARNASNPSIKKPIVNYGPCDIVGESIKIDTFLFEDGACKKWKVEYTYFNWCTNTTLGGFVHYYTYKDNEAPVLSCRNQMFAANPNPLNPSGGCEATVVLDASAIDLLICADESWVKWQSFIDLWNNGTVDRIASSFVNKAWEGIWIAVPRFIGTIQNPQWTSLQAQHPNFPLADPVYVTYIRPTRASGGTATLPAFLLDAENINHKVLWKITDGCGNVDQCESTLMVVDKKAPTPYCLSLSTALMAGTPPMVELWARDFDKGSFDNCTPQSKLYFTFRNGTSVTHPILSRLNEEHFFKGEGQNATAAEYNADNAYRWMPSARSAGKVWTAAGDYTVDVLVWDEAWNADFCSIQLKVISNSDPGNTISGVVKTMFDQAVNNVEVTVSAPLPEYPKSVKTADDGTFSFFMPWSPIPNVSISANKNGAYSNGVTTLDLVMIQRHILGMQSFDNKYKWIAADANNDGKVTASDLTDLRKLILGIITTLPKNDSWRFPKGDADVLTDPISFEEQIDIDNLFHDLREQNFVAVKIGDINGSADLSIGNPLVEPRNSKNVVLAITDQKVHEGEMVEIPVTAAMFNDVAGYQFTMNLNGARFVGVHSGTLNITETNIGEIAHDIITMSFANATGVTSPDGEVLFTLVLKSEKTGNISEMLSVGSGVTVAESYDSHLTVGKISLEVRHELKGSIVLYQNEPNPFRGQTTINFYMPYAAQASISVYDITGRLVEVRKVDASKGLNSEVFTQEQLGVSGVLYYTLDSGDYSATKKMIILE